MQSIPIKMVLVGDPDVGKTSLAKCLKVKDLPNDYAPTIFESHNLKITVDDKIIDLSIWDTGGQDETSNLRGLSYSEADLFLILFSVTDTQSLKNATKKWYPEVKEAVPKAVVEIVANKIDQRNHSTTLNKIVTTEEGMAEVKDLKCIYGECSVLSHQGLARVYEKPIRQVLKLKGYTKLSSTVGQTPDSCTCTVM